MNSLLAGEMYSEITNILLNKNIYKQNSVNMQFIKNYVRELTFIEKIDEIVSRKDYSCNSVFSLLRELMKKLVEGREPDNWLYEIYQYTLSKSFPYAVEINIEPNFITAFEIYIKILKVVSEFQKYSDDGTWQSKYPLIFLTPEEEEGLENSDEYKTFLKIFSDEYIYPMMKLNQEIMGYNTLDHICGVHFLAISLARQLQHAGLPVDLGRVSGAAAGHDIGKYGCKPSETKRVPYLHYYYTDKWFSRHDITYIRHIALNHSTWDLELENLPLESLILIYSDFRVKNKGKGMHIYSLAESFDVILQKLDNVDELKLKRYKRVYAKLKDFENFMKNLEIETDPSNKNFSYNNKLKAKKNNYSLMHGNIVVENLKFLSINHNIKLMYKLRTESSLNAILEFARSENDWKNLRQYLQIFEDYSTYLTQKQKLITLKFLYEELTHPEEDIRRKAAELIGILLAEFDEDYRKEVPENEELQAPEINSVELLNKYINLFLFPDYKIIPTHHKWIGYSLGVMIWSLFSKCRNKQISNYRSTILKYYSDNNSKSNDLKLYLLNAAMHIPISRDEESLEVLFDFIMEMMISKNAVVRLSALETAYNLTSRLNEDCIFYKSLKVKISSRLTLSKFPAENFLRYKIAKLLNAEESIIETYSKFCRHDTKKLSEIYLSNLKTATDWIIKKIQVDLLLKHALENPKENGFYTAMHFCNLLKVSANEVVRNAAGDALIYIVPCLSPEQRNDVAIELIRGLELEGYRFAEYIPYFLGQLILFLKPHELDEVIDDLIEKIKQSEPRINSLLLRTIGISIANYPKYKDLFPEAENVYEDRLIKMLGVLLNGLVNFNFQIKQMAFRVIGKEIFGSKRLTLNEKNHIFRLIAKKLLTLIADSDIDELMFLTKASGLNHIYKFISDYTFFYNNIDLGLPEKVAFFPGTFDPFSLSHKEIVNAIRNLGFEVYLSVDEFSWSKQTRPNLIRRNIINMSIADELSVYLYPEDYPANIANPDDLKTLKSNFPNSKIYIVVGSDVILNASAYKSNAAEDSVHTFSHIIFNRNKSALKGSRRFQEALNNIDGEIIRLSLPSQYEDISSTQIRDYIDQNRDISSLIDPLAQKYIYENGFYQREPQYKTLIQTVSIDIEVIENIDINLIDEISLLVKKEKNEVYKILSNFFTKPSARIILLRNISEGNRIIGVSMFHWARLSSLYEEFKNNIITEYIRQNAIGRITLIDGIFTFDNCIENNLEQIILTETLAFCLSKDYEYAIYKNIFEEDTTAKVYETLILQGFVKIPEELYKHPIFVVNMSSPCTLNLDLETVIKIPFRDNPNVSKALQTSRKKLQGALTQLYPGNLVLSFDRSTLYQTLIKKICAENKVSTLPSSSKKLGEAMCVPFGNILKRYVVPNTVTKSLHTEKLFSPDLHSYKVGPFPYYLSLENQVRMLHSFRRPIILVDDVLHKGYRMKVLDPLLKSQNINVQNIIVGILSGRGKELMDIQNRNVDCAYYIPKLRVWFNESLLYPFMGGDTLWRGDYPKRNLIPSINLILPYASPTFIRGASKGSIYNLSKISIENTLDIISTLEKEYQNMHERNLTLGLLGQVFISPRCPEHGVGIDYDLNLNTSHYLKNDLESLKRIENIINTI